MSQSSDSSDKWKWLNYLGAAILLVCYVGALSNVFKRGKQESQYDVIRIVHWQLEAGVREAFDEVIKRFEADQRAKGREVRVEQIPITERAYEQYQTTQLIGGTAPDLIQLGRGPEEYLGRYFLPLTKELQKPNHYIGERYAELLAKPSRTPEEERQLAIMADLKDRPWMDTFLDGLRTQYKERFFEYYGVGFSQFTVRMFYNRDMFREAMGTDEPPKDYRQLLEVCDRLQGYGSEKQLDMVPIASSKYQAGMTRAQYTSSFTSDLQLKFDSDLDGTCKDKEKLAAILEGKWTPHNEKYRASFDVMTDMSKYYNKGFMSQDRMESSFKFVQGKAAMIISGSWDAKSFVKRINDLPPENRFEVGIFEIPLPTAADPEYGKFFNGRVSEASSGTGFSFGITRFTRHQDLCLDFLRFTTTPEINTMMNDKAAWIPAVHGADMTPLLKPFKPQFVGYWGAMDFNVGPRSRMEEESVFWPFISGDIDFDEYCKRLWARLPEAAATDFARANRSWDEALPDRHAVRSYYLGLTAGADAPAADADADADAGPTPAQLEAELKLMRAWDALLDFEVYTEQEQMLVDRARKMDESGMPEETKAFRQAFFTQLQHEGM